MYSRVNDDEILGRPTGLESVSTIHNLANGHTMKP